MTEANQAAIIAENIKKLLIKNNMTQAELAKRVKISKSTMSDYMSTRTQPSHGVLEKIANVFGVGKSDIDTTYRDSVEPDDAFYAQRLNDLQHLLEENEEIYEVSATTNLPIVGKISCGKGEVAYENIEGEEPTPNTWLNGGKYFYLRAKGESMKGVGIDENDLLLIRQQEDVESGEIAAVYLDGNAVLKRVIKNDDGSITLRSENPNRKAYPPMNFNNGDIWIIGKLKKLVKSF